MIPLRLPAVTEVEHPFVTRLASLTDAAPGDTLLLDDTEDGALFAGDAGLMAIDGVSGAALAGDVVLVEPATGQLHRLLRRGSPHNTLLVTERCDQLCVMCSQPPKKTHVDRFALLEQACYLAEPDNAIGITGGEPTLYKEALFGLLERVLLARPDLRFHVLTNGQHFGPDDVARLRHAAFRRVTWGIPLYATVPDLHDEIVGKAGAFARLRASFASLLLAGARVELRTVLLQANLHELPSLARLLAGQFRFIDAWSIMQLEHVGFAKGRWPSLRVDHAAAFGPIAEVLDLAALHGVPARLFNFPLCTVPEPYRPFAVASISDWKRKLMPGCAACRVSADCSGFFEWHPDEEAAREIRPL